MPGIDIQLLEHKNLLDKSSNVADSLLPYYFPSLLLVFPMYLFFCIKHKICYLEYVTPSDFL